MQWNKTNLALRIVTDEKTSFGFGMSTKNIGHKNGNGRSTLAN